MKINTWRNQKATGTGGGRGRREGPKKGIKNDTKEKHKKNRTCERADFSWGQQELRRDDNRYSSEQKNYINVFFFCLCHTL